MKTIFKNICRVSILIFVVLILTFAFFISNLESGKIKAPQLLGVFLAFFALSTLVCLAAAFVLDAVESIKKNKFLYFFIMIINIIVIAYVYNYFAHYPNILNCLPPAVVYACAVKAGDYIFRSRK